MILKFTLKKIKGEFLINKNLIKQSYYYNSKIMIMKRNLSNYNKNPKILLHVYRKKIFK